MKISQLTPSEELLMNVLWRLDSAYMREIIAQYPEPKPHPNTISTFLKILVEKEFLSTHKDGRVFQYTVAIPFDDYRIYLLKQFSQDYFNNSSTQLIQILAAEKLLDHQNPKQLFEIKSSTISPQRKEEDTDLTEFINEIISFKRKKKKKKKKKGEKKKNKKKKNL